LIRLVHLPNAHVVFKRVLATVLWFIGAWALGSAVDFATGYASGLLGPVFALVASGIVAVDPLDLFQAKGPGANQDKRLSASPSRPQIV
jgi:hypothetical protein